MHMYLGGMAWPTAHILHIIRQCADRSHRLLSSPIIRWYGYMFIMENGASAASGSVHTLGDHSEDIARALTSLPYNVIPSVTVTKQEIHASDYASADVVHGNAIQQTYQVT